MPSFLGGFLLTKSFGMNKWSEMHCEFRAPRQNAAIIMCIRKVTNLGQKAVLGHGMAIHVGIA